MVLIVVTAAATFAGMRYFEPSRQEPVPEPLSVVPRWVGTVACAPMGPDEQAREALAVQVLRTFGPPAWMHIGAMRQLGRDRYRTLDKQTASRCHPDEMNDEIATALLNQRIFSPSYLHTDALRLARRIGPRDPQIIEAVARSAFHTHPIVTQYPELKQDVRSLARTTLAEFGTVAAPWRDQAFAAINAKDALGTSAAQIAVASGHPEALAKVSAMLDEILRNNRGDAIPRATRDRFYELAYALAAAGSNAAAHADPVIRIMARKVESWAPPFGMLSLPPRRMCRVLELIGGTDTKPILNGEICQPKIDTWER